MNSKALNMIINFILFIFILIEVLFFGPASFVQTIFAVISYIIVVFFVMENFQLGVFIYLIFTILSISSWSYIDFNGNNFLGIRFFGISINILCGFILMIYSIIKYNYIKIDKCVIIVLTFLGLWGFLNVLSGNNYLDNFIKDIKIYLTIIIFLILIQAVTTRQRLQLVYYGLIFSVIQMFISYVLNIKFDYDSNSQFVLLNTFSYLIPFIIIFSHKLFGRVSYILLNIFVFYLIVSGNFFVAGKTLIIIFIVLFWWLYHKSKFIFVAVLAGSIFMFSSLSELLLILRNYFDGTVTASRLTQIQILVDTLDLPKIASTKTSLGNAVAEFITVNAYLWNNIINLTLGLGFGGGVPDVNGNLSQFAGTGGYSIADRIRNNYFRMHLPLTEVLLKMGLIGVLIYFNFLKKYLHDFNLKSLAIIILSLFVFYVSKEMILLTIIFIYFPYDKKYEY